MAVNSKGHVFIFRGNSSDRRIWRRPRSCRVRRHRKFIREIGRTCMCRRARREDRQAGQHLAVDKVGHDPEMNQEGRVEYVRPQG